MNIDGITKPTKNINSIYQTFIDTVSENGIYNYRLYSLRLWDLNECIHNMKLKSTDIVLEFGAWNTYCAISIAQRIKTLYTTDSFSWTKRSYAKDFNDMSEYGTCSPEHWVKEFSKYKNIIAEKADIENLHYKDNMFDKIYSISVIEHVPCDLQAINEVYRVLKPGGIFTFTCEFHPVKRREFSSNTGYYRVYTPSDIIELISKSDFKLPQKLQRELNTSKKYIVDKEFTAISITLIK